MPHPIGNKPRLLVLTDISSLTAGLREPDDGQSMVRLMLYANDLDIEGLIASSHMQHGQTVRPELIREVVSAYGQVRPNLLLHSDQYPCRGYVRHPDQELNTIQEVIHCAQVPRLTQWM